MPQLIERLDGVVLPAAKLLNHRTGVGGKCFGRAGNLAELGDLPGDFLLAQTPGETWNFDDVDRRHARGENVLGDFQVDPSAPLAAAPLAGEIVRRNEGQEQSRAGQAVVDSMAPVVEAADLLLIEKAGERTVGAELGVLDQQFVNEAVDPIARIVAASVRHEEVVLVGIARHEWKPVGKAAPRSKDGSPWRQQLASSRPMRGKQGIRTGYNM